MFGTRIVATAILWGVSCAAALGAELELYPGAKTDKWVKSCLAGTKKERITADKFLVTNYYVTPDPFDRVVEFYGKLGKPRPVSSEKLPKLPNGATAQMTKFFIGAPVSGELVIVQRPAACMGGTKEVRDVTLIQVTRNKKRIKK